MSCDCHVMQGRNPFQRDFRKSVFRDGSVYSQWMQRMYDYNIEASHVIVM
jgi:hypothetical protein